MKVIRSARTSMWFNGFYYHHKGEQKTSIKVVDWSVEHAKVVSSSEVDDITDEIANVEGYHIRVEIFNLSEEER